MPIDEKETFGQKRNGWEDDFMRGADFSKKFMDVIMSERSQLYGTLIHMFVKYELDELELPERVDLNEYGRKYYLLFHKKENGKFYLTLKEQEQNEQPIEKTVLD